MFRFLVILLLAVCIAGGVGYGMGLFDEWIITAPSTNRTGGVESSKNVDLGGPLYSAAALPQQPKGQAPAFELLPIDPCHVIVWETQEVSFVKDGGQLLFLGEALANAPAQSDPKRPIQTIPVSDGVSMRPYNFLKIDVNDIVEPDQIVALVNPEFALREHESKKLKLDAAKAELKGTEAVLSEVIRRLQTNLRLASGAGGKTGVISELEIGEAKVTVAKYEAEQITKSLAIQIAEAELASAKLYYDAHFLKSKLHGKGIVKNIYKKDGEGIKAQEAVMQLWNISTPRIKGSVDSQYANTLLENLGAKCYLEPSVELAPQMQLIQAHHGEVTCVGVCADGEHFVSGGDDRNVFVWKRGDNRPVMLPLKHSAAVRTLACSPKGMWVLVGCADGSIWRWDLTEPSTPVKFKDQHRGPVTALAFSPEVKNEDGTVEAEAGKWFASGGEDNSIYLWTTAEGEVLSPYEFVDEHGAEAGHQGTVTSLHFTPQGTLVSAARDSTLRVWQLHQKGAKLVGDSIANRGGTVSRLGVSADGRYMLFDKGKTLQFLNPADGSPAGCELVNLAGSNPFDTLALFSPDGSLMLTGGAGDGRLDLWKTPSPTERGYQVRELVSQDRAPITSAAFGPKGFPFAVTGSKEGYVHLWPLPDEQAVTNHRIFFDGNKQPLQLNLVDFEVAAGKTTITVNVNNPIDRFGRFQLKPGQRVTLVVMLPAHK